MAVPKSETLVPLRTAMLQLGPRESRPSRTSRSVDSLSSFKSQLKSTLFLSAYGCLRQHQIARSRATRCCWFAATVCYLRTLQIIYCIVLYCGKQHFNRLYQRNNYWNRSPFVDVLVKTEVAEFFEHTVVYGKAAIESMRNVCYPPKLISASRLQLQTAKEASSDTEERRNELTD